MGLNAFLSSAGATYNVDRGEILPPADANLQHIGRQLEGYIGSNTGEHGKQSMRPQMEQDGEKSLVLRDSLLQYQPLSNAPVGILVFGRQS